MCRALVALGLLLSLTACSTSNADAGSGSGSGSTPTPSASAFPFPDDDQPIDGVVLDMATVCMTADSTYVLEPAEQRILAAGRAAEAKGDTTGVKAALDKLKPVFTRVSATLADTAGKVADPELKAALTSLAQSAAKSAEFKSFTEFQSLAAMTAAPEAILKKKCADSGNPLFNLE